MNEKTALLSSKSSGSSKDTSCSDESSSSAIKTGGLSLFFTILCIVDLFGVFPVVTLPKVVISTGIYGVPIVLFVFSMQIYTAILLGRCWLLAEKINPDITHKNRYPYAALAEMTFGSIMSNFVTILLDATVFGGGIPNLLVASQNLQLFGIKISQYRLDFSFCWWLIIIGILLCPIMWLGSPKDMKSLASLSVVVVTIVMCMTCYCIMNDSKGKFDPTVPEPKLRDILMAYGILAFQFDIHPMLLTIQVDMKDSTRIGIAVVVGFLVTGTMFLITSSLAAYRYGINITSNILQGLPASLPLYIVVLFVTIQLCLSSAVGSSALFQHIEDKLRISREFNSKRCFIRAFIVAFAVFLGETVPRFDIVMGLIGSTLTGPLVFILPPLFYGKLLYIQSKNLLEKVDDQFQISISHNQKCFQKDEKVSDILDDNSDMLVQQKANKYLERSRNKQLCSNICNKLDLFISLCIMCFGIVATLIATYYSWADAIAYATFTPPCLINITAASHNLQI